MEYLKILLVFSCFVYLSVSEVPPAPLTKSSSGSSSTNPHSTTPDSTTPPTSDPPTTKSTTAPPTSKSTTASSTSKPTTAPSTSKPTTAPSTSKPTTAPSTSKPTTASSTSKPTTAPSSTIAPTPAPTPSPKPVDPSVGNWSLNYTKSNYTCLVIDAALQIELLMINSTSKKINVPVNATTDGTCGNNSDILNLRWDGNVVTMNFTKNATEKKFELEFVRVFLNGTENLTLVHKKPEFKTLLDHSYKCAKLQTLNFTEEHKNDTVAYIHISHAQFQAFSNVTGHHFYDAIDCESSSITSDVVPIVVGCVLAVLVVVVLVAYLYGRRRCQARGYLSM